MSLPIFATLAVLQAPTSQIASMIFMYGAIFAIMYFILIRPQQRQRKKHEALVRELKRGDEIVTAGGIVAEVLHINPGRNDKGEVVPSMDDRITIKSGESRLVIERGRITRVISPNAAPSA